MKIRIGAAAALVIAAASVLAWITFEPARQQPPPSGAPHMPPPETFAAIFEPCAHCHEIGRGARSMTAPPLTGIVGRKAASFPHYPYSKAMRESGLVWDKETLRRFLASPTSTVPGTRMLFGGLPDDEIDPMIEFLKTAGQKPATAVKQ
jgi:cytochrome c